MTNISGFREGSWGSSRNETCDDFPESDQQSLKIVSEAMMGTYDLLNPLAGWAAVCVSKKGCTSLKAQVLTDHGMPGADFMAIHDGIGYDASSSYLRDVRDGIPEDLETFAVWRDPVERFKSVFKHFALGGGMFRNSALRM